MPINFYTPTFRQQVNPIDLNVLARTYNTLEQGHQQAIQTKSQIDAQLAQLDLNEAEDAWRQEQLNKVRNALTENMQYGNAYSSLDDIVGTYGDITSSPGMIGRLRAQQDYKAYMDNLDKRTDLSEDYKNYYRAVNKYNYQDITDKNGNVIGGSKWTPIDKEVSEIPMNQILNQALQWAAKEQGGGSQTRWLDANGKVTDDITKSVTGEIYSHTKGNWQRLSKAKLAEAVKAVIENTPGAKASLEQDYKIAKWKYDQNGSNPDITDKNGILLTPEQYLAKRIDPFYNAATFYNQDSNTTYGEAWKAQLALSKQAGSGSSAQRKQAIDNLTYKGTPVRIDNFMPAQAQAEITSNRQSIAGLLNKYNPDINIDLATANPNDIRTSIMTNITSPSDRAYALSYLNDIIDNQEYINSLKVGKSQDSIDGFDTYNSIISLSDLPNNKYSDTYSKYVNQIFIDGAFNRKTFASIDSIDAIILATGAALSKDMNETIQKTKQIVSSFNLPKTNSYIKKSHHMAVITKKDVILLTYQIDVEAIEFKGALTTKMVNYMVMHRMKNFNLIIEDPTKIMIDHNQYEHLNQLGVKLFVLNQIPIIALTINPFSPSGHHYDKSIFYQEIKKQIDIDIYNVKEMGS